MTTKAQAAAGTKPPETETRRTPAESTVRTLFDVAYLYYLTQYLPVYEALGGKSSNAAFVVYERKRQPSSIVREVVEKLGLPATWVHSQEEALEVYRREHPDWIVFGHNYDLLAELPDGTRSAQLHHGIGMKADVYDEGLFDMDVRFTEGPHYTEVLARKFPKANLVEVGYAKVDPLFWSTDRHAPFDLAAAGLDPARPTLMYAPTSFPSSFGAMPDRLPKDFGDCNVIVKAHQFSHFNPKYKDHRRKMARWSSAPNVFIVPPEEFNPNPYFSAADLLISDASSVLFEFAATGKPVVWCDFFKLRLNYRGPFRYRLERRMDHAIERYADICAHAGSYKELGRVVREELVRPESFAEKRREYTQRLIGPTDGCTGERVAEYLLKH
ncbi:MAG: CDP-glycerol--poly(glycerophosphate) glycerophosphotransferase [bacterium]|nr:CDP-glycerol--poly(glycerophosphate) glycerophosphotransferase [bacterium]